MSFEQAIGLAAALSVMAIGLAGAILPAVPGTPLVLLAAIGHRLYFGPHSVDLWALLILAVLTLVSFVLDHLAGMAGAKTFGATRRGVIGAFAGGLVGLFFGIVGLILGPFLGAVLFELSGRRTWREARRAGMGAVLGLLAGTVGKVACCLAMIGLFTLNVLYRSMS